ncbi:carboxypeptidase M32 [Nisaea acidiphila]|uniref:Metal-dependent carboxypeptidase n=1 Tax=Nisaea acidiphila TaxID=1862145 RepID=A0A9J7B2S8_9PROT|nr:carboxypeptidase M32 [Nisaea acidiphila]UUX51957.1 carboxypeptidase M32 [Nisaea acidiphila]
MSNNPYTALETRFRRYSALSGASAILGWDQETMMPSGGAEARAEQLATLDVLQHELLSAPAVGEELAEAEAATATLTPWQQANLREMRRVHTNETVAPADLVEARSRATSACVNAWREARRQDDFSAVSDKLAKVLDLTRQYGEIKAEKLGCSLYDALIDSYEPGGTMAWIDPIFATLKTELPALMDGILAHQAAGPAPLAPEGPFPAAKQKALGEKVMAALGFDFTHGRLDESAHPFTGGIPEDIRITTRYSEEDFTRALMGVIHETGHALYESGLPQDWRGQPVGSSRGMVMHESQSLLMEMQACRAPAFYRFLAPLAAETLGADGPAVTPENLNRLGHRVSRGLIRVDADEVTYPLHVMLRYDFEKALLSGDLQVKDLPGAWRDGMKTALGVAPEDDRDGCLQDIHWYHGSFGYFPTYTLGALAAAQLFKAAKDALPELDAQIAEGDFAPLLGWLRANVHEKASSRLTDEILTEATGAELGADAFLAHLRTRYLG